MMSDRLINKLSALAKLADSARLPSEPQGVTRQQLYDTNKVLHDIRESLVNEVNFLREAGQSRVRKDLHDRNQRILDGHA